MGIDEIAEKLTALGVPGLILVYLVSTSSFFGAAAITSSLALLGGPAGMLGGIATLGVISLISGAIATYGTEAIAVALVKNLKSNGKTNEELLNEIAKFPISNKLKRKLREVIETSI
jgi:hypothetical protein